MWFAQMLTRMIRPRICEIQKGSSWILDRFDVITLRCTERFARNDGKTCYNIHSGDDRRHNTPPTSSANIFELAKSLVPPSAHFTSALVALALTTQLTRQNIVIAASIQISQGTAVALAWSKVYPLFVSRITQQTCRFHNGDARIHSC